MKIKTPLYELTLDSDWTEALPSRGAQKLFTSSRHASTLSVMSQELTEATSKNTVEAARMLLAMRLDAENKIAEANQNPITIADPILVAQPWGASLAYYGSDLQGRQFQYSAAVWPRQILTLFLESNRLTQAQLKAVMGEVLGGVAFNVDVT